MRDDYLSKKYELELKQVNVEFIKVTKANLAQIAME